jgi:DNA-binding MarR family transcriptional regulator
MGTSTELTTEQADVWRSFVQMQEVLNSRLEQQLQRTSGLSNADYTILAVLSDAADRHCRVYELGEMLGWEKSRLHHQLTRMSQRDLVRREPDPNAPRAMYVTITPTGLKAIAEATPAHNEEIHRLFLDQISDRQVSQLSGICRRILKGLLAPPEPST